MTVTLKINPQQQPVLEVRCTCNLRHLFTNWVSPVLKPTAPKSCSAVGAAGRQLAEGNIVELGDFSSFWLRINAEGQEAAEEVRPNHITNTLPRFTPWPGIQRGPGKDQVRESQFCFPGNN